MCSEIVDVGLNLTVSRKERYLRLRPLYQRIAAQYLLRRFVDPQDILTENEQQKISKVIWATFHVPILVMGMLVNDEVFIEERAGWTEWDPMGNEMVNWRVVQFEWLWDDTLDSMRLLRCWMTQGHRRDDGRCELERDDPLNQFLFPIVNKTNANRGGSAPFTEWYIEEIRRLFDPCFRLWVQTVLRDRPNLVLGPWSQWDHFGY